VELPRRDPEGSLEVHSLSTRLLSADNLSTALDDVLENAIMTTGASFGNIQLYNPQIGALEIVVQRGFRQNFLLNTLGKKQGLLVGRR
jgi:hypothetical protein